MTGDTHSFTLFVHAVDVDAHADALYESGCDDALLGSRDGLTFLMFDRGAPSLGSAIASAVRDVQLGVPTAEIVRVEPDDLVSAAAIAERAGISREYVRLLSTGARGPGGFPPPALALDGRTRAWHWHDVAVWLAENGKAEKPVDTAGAAVIAAVNAALELRRQRPRLAEDERALIETVLA